MRQYTAAMLESYEAALARIAALPARDAEWCAVAEAAGMVLAEPVRAAAAVPASAIARIDGVAVAAADVSDASPWAPIALARNMRVRAGAPVPAGCDALLPAALVDADGAAIGAVAPGANVLAAGGAAAAGALLAPAGMRILDPLPAALRWAAIAEVLVRPSWIAAAGPELPFAWLRPCAAGPRVAGGIAIELAEDAAISTAAAEPVLHLPPDLFGAIAAALALGLPLLCRRSGVSARAAIPLALTARIASPPGLATVVLLAAEGGRAVPLPWGNLGTLAEATHFTVIPSASEGFAAGALVPARSLAI